MIPNTLFPLKHFKNSTTSSFELHVIVLYSKPDVSMYRYLSKYFVDLYNLKCVFNFADTFLKVSSNVIDSRRENLWEMTLYSMNIVDDPKLVSDFEFCRYWARHITHSVLGDGTRINTKLSNLNRIVPQRTFFTWLATIRFENEMFLVLNALRCKFNTKQTQGHTSIATEATSHHKPLHIVHVHVNCCSMQRFR